MSTGAIIAAAHRRAERRLIDHLRNAAAVNAASATRIPDQSWIGSRAVRRLTAAGAIRDAGGRYYLDEPAYVAYRSRRVRNGVLVLATLAITALAIVWWVSVR